MAKYLSKISSISSETISWGLSVGMAWVVGRGLLWPILTHGLQWMSADRTEDLVLNERNQTLYESRVPLAGTILILLMALAALALSYQFRMTARARSVATRVMHIMWVGYLYYYWLLQPVYWWYSSPRDLNPYATGLMWDLNLVRAVAALSILTVLSPRYSPLKLEKYMTDRPSGIIRLLGIQIGIYGVIWILCFGSAVSSPNFGIPATIALAGLSLVLLSNPFEVLVAQMVCALNGKTK